MRRRRLPIGIQTFRTIREMDAYHVDKAPRIQRLLDEGSHYLLSRPLVERRYAEKYAGESVRLVGVEFSSRTRNVERFEVRAAA